jgi:hypothetical protein
VKVGTARRPLPDWVSRRAYGCRGPPIGCGTLTRPGRSGRRDLCRKGTTMRRAFVFVMTCAALCCAATSAIAGGSPIEFDDGDDLREPG